MTVQTYTFAGRGCWIKTRPNDYGKFDFNFFPADKSVATELRATGIKNKPQLPNPDTKSYAKIPADLQEKQFYILRSDQPYAILNPDGTPFEGLVGNGSGVTVQLAVEKFTSPTHGDSARSKVLAVIITDPVPFEPKAPTVEGKVEVPA